MNPSTEQFTAATRSQIESQLSLTTVLTDKMIDGMQKMFDLNLHAAKATMEASVANAQKLISAKDPQEFFSMSATGAAPQAEMAMSYSRHLANIASATQMEFTKAAESQIAENSRKLVSLFDQATKLAPAGSENAIAMVKSAITQASAGYEQLTKNTKMAVEAIETNMNSAASQMTEAAAKASGRSTKK